MPALIGANAEEVRRHHTIKSGPIGLGKMVMHFAGHRRHEGDGVVLSGAERAQARLKVGIGM